MTPGPVVLKFGGESLADPEKVAARIDEVRAERLGVIVVVSARAGVTDLLKSVRGAGANGVRGRDLARSLETQHPDLPPAGRRLLRDLPTLVDELRRRRAPDAAGLDRLLSQGERLAAHWFAAYLTEHGTPAVAVEADRLGLLTENCYGGARILMRPSERRVRAGLMRLLDAGQVPIVTGFFGRSLEGKVATLGRGGSDYSASALGALVRASRVELVKAGVAISTADPRLVPDAAVVDHLSYEEAEELAQFGARVLHPITIEPARERSILLVVRSLRDGGMRTRIGRTLENGTRAVTRLGPMRLLNVRIAGGRQRPGLLSEISGRLQAADVNVAAVVTTEAVLGLLVEPHDAARAHRALRPFSESTGAVLGRPTPVSLVSVIGEGILDELDRIPRRILHGSQGMLATGRSVSIVVPEPNAVAAVRALHRAFVPRPRRARARA